jgi:hypothetical protein
MDENQTEEKVDSPVKQKQKKRIVIESDSD